MRTEHLYLHDIIEACDAISTFIEGRTREEFLHDDFFQSAVMAKFGIIGVSISNLSAELRDRYPDVAWHEARGLRNIVVHTYFSIDWDVLWVTARDDIPTLRVAIAEIVNREFTDTDEH